MKTAPRYEPLPDGIIDAMPGTVLSSRLWALDPLRYNGFQLVQVVQAQYRQVCAELGRFLFFTRALARSSPGDSESPPRQGRQPDEHADTELACALGLSNAAASELLAMAETSLTTAPSIHDAILAGDVDMPKARMLTKELAGVAPADAEEAVAQVRDDLAGRTVEQLRHQVRRTLLAIDPASATRRITRAQARRRVRRETMSDGTASLIGLGLPVERAAAAWEHVDAVARAAHASGDHFHRTLDQLRADVFADLLAGSVPQSAGNGSGTAGTGVVHLHVALTTLAGLDQNPGEIEGFGPVLADVARQVASQIAEHAKWRFTATDQHGAVIAEGPLRYRPTPSQRHFVAARDRTCRAPGCRQPARHCDIDHVRRWPDGPTTIDNLITLCRRHHRAKHAGGHQARVSGTSLEWTTPRGHTYTTAPPPELCGPAVRPTATSRRPPVRHKPRSGRRKSR